MRTCSGKLTEDARNNNGLDVLCAGLVGVSREIGNVQAQGGIVAQNTVEICKRHSTLAKMRGTTRGRESRTGKEGPGEFGTADRGVSGDAINIGDGATSPAQGVAKNGQENNGCNYTLESKEVLDLGVRDAQEGQLKQEIEQKADHSCSSNALILGNVIGDVFEARPDGCEQHGHALAASGGLDTACRFSFPKQNELIGRTNSPEPHNSEHAAGQDDEVAEVVAEGHTREHGERSVQLSPGQLRSALLEAYKNSQ